MREWRENMKNYRIPVFKAGNMLTHEMLDAMMQYGIGFAEYSYAGYSDGVVAGCDVHGEKGVIYVEKGLVYHYGNLITFEGGSVRASPSNEWQAVKLCVADMEQNPNYNERQIDIRMVTRLERERNSVELCRVKLQRGAVIRSVYQSYEDFDTEYDTINLIHAQWAAYGEEGIHPAVLNGFAADAMKHGISDARDISFIQQILSHGGRALPRKAVQYYIAIRQGNSYKELANGEIYKQLGAILRQIRTGKAPEAAARKDRRIIVD